MSEAEQRWDRRQLEPALLNLMSCLVLLCSKDSSALADFSGYLTRLLQKHSVYACDGNTLTLQCPRHSTISIQSAFYGHTVQSHQMCSTQQPNTLETANCMAETTFQKVQDECQNVRSCQFPVNNRLFGPDPCPGLTKYLLVSFKCKPTEYKTKSACEDSELKLHCHESKFLNIYEAAYGRWGDETETCLPGGNSIPQFDCLSFMALEILSQRCYGKQKCNILVNDNHFGAPCLPGVKKYLTVHYACVPKIILTAVDPKISNQKPSLEQNDDLNLDPRGSRLPDKDGIILSNSLATLAYIRAHPERAALLFMCSVCMGLAFTLCALVIRVSCTMDVQKLHQANDRLLPECNQEDSSGEESDEEESSHSAVPDEFLGFRKPSLSAYNSMEAAELAERIERRDQLMQEIWMNSASDAFIPRCISPYY
ncbi:protein eva-1 homolog C isoform X2 [Rhinatrema bivittatum]|uniref:protein eva-1 homolog C isoform X2 n=1 Tax=Rhinatrema bivittatum TaxID=194408 RepID=UPI0011296B26|nr:protein eva-1 homolog C isoform X2 [Rhinatrema bivittatum]